MLSSRVCAKIWTSDMSISDLKRFVFDGVLVKDALTSLSKHGISVDVVTEKSVISRAEQMNFPLRIMNEAGKMASVFVLFFSVENSARELITQRLTERHGAEWWAAKVPQKIRDHVEKLRNSEQIHRYHTPRSSDIIGYTTFGQLEQIIIANWDDFSDIIPSQAWISSRFKDMEISRNVIMHTGILQQFDIDRIEMMAHDWITQVG